MLIAEGNGCCIGISYEKEELFYFSHGDAFKYHGAHAGPEVSANSARRPKSRGRTPRLYDPTRISQTMQCYG